MKNQLITLAALTGVFAALTALLLSFRSPVNAESIVGYAIVLALLGVTALEYRIDWKRLFSRS